MEEKNTWSLEGPPKLKDTEQPKKNIGFVPFNIGKDTYKDTPVDLDGPYNWENVSNPLLIPKDLQDLDLCFHQKKRPQNPQKQWQAEAHFLQAGLTQKLHQGLGAYQDKHPDGT